MAGATVVRLVTQFDTAETQRSLATPTCCGGCCCCCCCCLATIIGSSSLTAMHVHALEKTNFPQGTKAWPTVLAVFALPITLLFGIVTIGYGLAVAPFVWAALVAWAYSGARASSPIWRGVGVAFVGSLVFCAEFVLAFFALDAFGAYLFLSVVIGLAATIAGYALIK